MGKVKVPLKPIANAKRRQVTYSKRKNGIIKKIKDLSILCDIDIALFVFSPTGKSSLCLGEKSKFDEVLGRFCQLTPQDREKRRLEGLEVLKKIFEKLDHDVSVEDHLTRKRKIEQLLDESQVLQVQISAIQHKLWLFGNEPHNINTLEQAKIVEGKIQDAMLRMHVLKGNLKHNQQTVLVQTVQQLAMKNKQYNTLAESSEQWALKNEQYNTVGESSGQMFHGDLDIQLSMNSDHAQIQPMVFPEYANDPTILEDPTNFMLMQGDLAHVEDSNHFYVIEDGIHFQEGLSIQDSDFGEESVQNGRGGHSLDYQCTAASLKGTGIVSNMNVGMQQEILPNSEGGCPNTYDPQSLTNLFHSTHSHLDR